MKIIIHIFKTSKLPFKSNNEEEVLPPGLHWGKFSELKTALVPVMDTDLAKH